MSGRARAAKAFGIAWRLAVLFAIVMAARQAGDMISDRLTTRLTPSTEPALLRLIMASMVACVLLMALPFVPGAEIGFAMMLVFGSKAVPLIYGATVLAMALAFGIGRLLPQDRIVQSLSAAGLGRIAGLFQELQPLSPAERAAALLGRAPGRWASIAVRSRYLALALLLNLPGNAVLGGGGGICMMAGFSRFYWFPAFLFTVCLAILPVPLMVLLTD